jgi:glutathione synthase/RimK-type ligase-like ATP-grasp enzyme
VLVLLVTFSLLPDGEPGGALLTDALTERGIDSRWVVWDDASVEWGAADLVAVRATWDYHRRTAEFLAWARTVQPESRLLNGADVFAWNADKSYLVDLGDLVPTVPTELLDDSSLVPGLQAAADRWGEVVIKPRVGASGIGVVVVTGPRDERLQGLAPAPWVVQPLVGSVRTVGETSVYVLGGRAVSQVDKLAAGGEIRVHEMYGGSSRPVPLDPERAALAEAAVAAAAARWSADLAYARVDLMHWDDAWTVSELELIEPGLYLDIDPANAGRFADLVRSLL